VIIAELFGYLACVTSIIGLLPQIYKTYKTKTANDLSMLMLINYLICSAAWIVHGLYADLLFVVFSNIVGLFTSLISIIQKRYYED
jgi:MtN3 and saliva related transmembrane protein